MAQNFPITPTTLLASPTNDPRAKIWGEVTGDQTNTNNNALAKVFADNMADLSAQTSDDSYYGSNAPKVALPTLIDPNKVLKEAPEYEGKTQEEIDEIVANGVANMAAQTNARAGGGGAGGDGLQHTGSSNSSSHSGSYSTYQVTEADADAANAQNESLFEQAKAKLKAQNDANQGIYNKTLQDNNEILEADKADRNQSAVNRFLNKINKSGTALDSKGFASVRDFYNAPTYKPVEMPDLKYVTPESKRFDGSSQASAAASNSYSAPSSGSNRPEDARPNYEFFTANVDNGGAITGSRNGGVNSDALTSKFLVASTMATGHPMEASTAIRGQLNTAGGKVKFKVLRDPSRGGPGTIGAPAYEDAEVDLNGGQLTAIMAKNMIQIEKNNGFDGALQANIKKYFTGFRGNGNREGSLKFIPGAIKSEADLAAITDTLQRIAGLSTGANTATFALDRCVFNKPLHKWFASGNTDTSQNMKAMVQDFTGILAANTGGNVLSQLSQSEMDRVKDVIKAGR